MCLQGFDLLAKWESRQNSRACISNSCTESEVEVLLKNLFSTFFYLHIQLHFYKHYSSMSEIGYLHISYMNHLDMKSRKK